MDHPSVEGKSGAWISTRRWIYLSENTDEVYSKRDLP
jgi:hypothetical protein